MRQVDACDFCGDAPDGVFEVVPAAVPDGPVRLALCADCRTTLETVVDPLLAADADSSTAPLNTDDADAAPSTPTAMRDSSDETESGDATDDTTDGDTPGGPSDDPGVSDDDSGGPGGNPGGSSDGSDGVTIEQQGGGTPAQRPDGYAQLLRLLENRDGGMARDDLRALATNAYDLTDRTFEAAVDAAIQNGDVEDTSGGLRRT